MDTIEDILLDFRSFAIVNFGGDSAPPKKSKEPNQDYPELLGNYLFVPTAYNYPGFDFVYYMQDKNTAFFFQVTIMKNCASHIKTNDKNATTGTLSSTMKVRPD